MSKPTDAVERAVDFLEYQCGRPAALPFLDSDRFVVGEIMSRYAAAEVAAYREALRALVKAANDYNQKLYRAVANDTVRYEADPLHAAEKRLNKAPADAAALLNDQNPSVQK